MTVSTPSPLFPEDAPAARCDLPIGGELFQPQGNPDLVFTLTSQGRIASLGWPLAEHCDLSLSQFLGKDLSDLVAESEREPLERILALLWQRETPTLDPCELVLDAYRLQGSLHLYPLPPPPPTRHGDHDHTSSHIESGYCC